MDTVEPLVALAKEIGGSQRSVARMMKISRATLNRLINNKHQQPPRLDSLAAFSRASYEQTGIGLSFSWNPGCGLQWEIYNQKDR